MSKRKCCFIPEDQQDLNRRQSDPLPDGFGCQNDAAWQIWYGNGPDDNTESCTTHVGEILTDAAEHRIYPAENEG